MKKLLLSTVLSITPIFAAANPDDPERNKIKALAPDIFETVYVDELRRIGCVYDYDADRATRDAFWERYLTAVYDEAGISEASRQNDWVEGDALAQSDNARFRLMDVGIMEFDEDARTLTLLDC